MVLTILVSVPLALLLVLLVVVCIREYIHHKRSRGE
jgi:hypothetical protein